MLEVKCQDLGIVDCSYVARGKTPGDMLEDIVPHLRSEHDLDMPPSEELLEIYQAREPEVANPVANLWEAGADDSPPLDEGVRLVTSRLIEALSRSNL